MKNMCVYNFTKGMLSTGYIISERLMTFGEAVKIAKDNGIEYDEQEGVIAPVIYIEENKDNTEF